MRKLLSIFLLTSSVFAGDIDTYWDFLYNHISSCLEQAERNAQIYKPIFPVKSREDLLNYLKALPLQPGYYILVDTSGITSSRVCYLEYISRKNGFSPLFLPAVDKLIYAVVSRKADAQLIVNELRKIISPPSVVFWVPVF